MLKCTQLIGFGGGNSRFPKPNVNAVDFNGSSDRLSRSSGMSGAVDSSNGVCSVWFRIDGGDGNGQYLLLVRDSGAGNGNIFVFRDSTNNLTWGVRNSSETRSLLWGTSGGSVIASSAWHHLAFSWSTNFSAGNKSATAYLDGSYVAAVDGSDAFLVDYTVSDWGIAAALGGGAPFNGALAELYLNTVDYLDLTDGNLPSFRSDSGKPIELGVDGSSPSGNVPLIYLPSPAATVNVNAGTGGNFTINGTPTVASTSPSD